MSFDDDVFGPMHASLFETFGVDATVTRGVDAAAPVRIVVSRDQEVLGEHGQFMQRVTTVETLVEQWQPKNGDVFAWTDRLGNHSRKVDRPLENDGFVAKAVLHG